MANLASGRRDAPSAKLSSLYKAPKLKRVGKRALPFENSVIPAGRSLNKRKVRKRSVTKRDSKRPLPTLKARHKARSVSCEDTAAESA